jgi:hypothetical protein
MTLELFPEVDPSHLDDLLDEIDSALDACFLAEVAVAFDRARAPSDVLPDAAAA